MSKDLIKLKQDEKLRKIQWTPGTYFQFANAEAQELYEKNPDIKWQYGDAALDLFRQGKKPSQFEHLNPHRGQGYIYINPLFKTPEGTLTSVVELIPANNKGDNLDGKTAEGKDFEYKGKKIGVYTDERLGGNSGGVHTEGKKKLPDLNPELYSEEKGYFHRYPAFSGGIFVGEEHVMGQFRASSGVINEQTFIVNPLFRLYHCNNTGIKDPDDGSEFWYNRLGPIGLSDSLLNFLSETLPKKDDQKPGVTVDYRTVEPTAGFLKTIENWKKISSAELKTGMEQRLLYFSRQVYTDINAKDYELCLMSAQAIDDDTKIEKNKFYIRNFDKNTLEYAVLGPDGNVNRSFISKDQLPQLSNLLAVDNFRQAEIKQCQKFLNEILEITANKGHTLPKRRDNFYNVEEVVYQCREQNVAINLDVQDELGRTALSHCIESNSKKGLDLRGDIATLIKFGANLFLEDKSGKTPCDYDKEMNIPAVLIRLANNAEDRKDYNEVQRLRNLLVEYFARKLHNEGYQFVEGSYKKSTLPTDEKSTTPFQLSEIKAALESSTLFHAVVQHSPHLTYDILANFRPNLTIKDNFGKTAFDYFLTKNQSHPDDMYNLERFLTRQADFTVEWNLPFEIPLKLQSESIAPLLFAEAAEGIFEKFLLVRKCFHVNIFQPGSGLRLLHFAVRSHNLEIIKVLLQSGANPNFCTVGGANPLHLLMSMATHEPQPELQIEIVKQLLATNIDLSARNNNDMTVLDMAPSFLRPVIIAALEKDSASTHASSNRYTLYNSSRPLKPVEAEQGQEISISI